MFAMSPASNTNRARDMVCLHSEVRFIIAGDFVADASKFMLRVMMARYDSVGWVLSYCTIAKQCTRLA